MEDCTVQNAIIDQLRETLSEQTKEIEALLLSRNFYQRRCDLLEKWQSQMRDPERTIVCDILANGQMLPDPNGERYGRRESHLVFEPVSKEEYDA